MGTFGRAPDRAPLRDIGLLLVAAFGLAACVTLIWLGMRAVMDIGGACAEGGPFVPVQPCPDGAPAALVLGMLGLFAFGGLGLYAGVKVGGPWAALPLLGWPALFLSLGWNFLEYGVNAGGDEGLVWGWLIPGVIFVVMGAVPLWIAWATRSSAVPLGKRFGMPYPASRPEPAPSLGWDPSHRRPVARTDRATPAADPARANEASPSSSRVAPSSAPGAAAEDASPDLVDRLERLAGLRRRGDLTTDEFEQFKAALLRDADGRS